MLFKKEKRAHSSGFELCANTPEEPSISPGAAQVGHFISLIEREPLDHIDECPICKSRDARSHFDHAIEPCGACYWSSHPGTRDEEEETIS